MTTPVHEKPQSAPYVNPPAFPNSVAVDHMDGLNYSSQQGMTLRDYFAGLVLQGMFSGESLPPVDWGPEIARRAYLFADAMLAERAKAVAS